MPPGRFLYLIRQGHTVVVFPRPSAPVFGQEMALSVDGQEAFAKAFWGEDWEYHHWQLIRHGDGPLSALAGFL